MPGCLILMRLLSIGDAKTRGISGGEKKRLSIGNELINLQNGDKTNADVVVFADEPTSGLDSYQALKVVELLRVFLTLILHL